jgi:hypothetical protein
MTGRVFTGQVHPDFNPFTDNYLSEMLLATCTAWARMRHPPIPEIEDKLTRRLAGCLMNEPDFRELPYEVTFQHWLLGADGQAIGRVDLRFKHRYSQRDYFALEAKRLHVTYPGGGFSTEYATYAGTEGMMAFVEGQYSEGLPAAGMIGYVMDARSSEAWTGLEKTITARGAALRLVSASQFTTSTLAEAVVANGLRGTYLGETLHSLIASELRLFHLVLPVNAIRQPVVRSRRGRHGS